MLVLIAGGAGLMGAAIAEALLSEGHEVVLADVFDDRGDGTTVKEERAARLGRHPWARVVRGDLTDPAFASKAVADARPAAVVNAALFVPGSAGVAPLANAARAAGIGCFLHLSDAALYGPPPAPGRHASEDEEVSPEGDLELLARAREEDAVREAAVPAAILRVFEIVGPAFPVHRFPMPQLEALLAGREVPPLPAGERDFVHVRDAARAVSLALAKRPAGATLNVGTGIGASPRSVVERLARLASVEARFAPEVAPRRVPRVADVERVFSTLGFSPELGLDRALQEIVRVRLARGAPASRPDTPAAVRDAGPAPLSRRQLFDIFRRKG
jgi:nucleoside-diphosphate-sugar epimerase